MNILLRISKYRSLLYSSAATLLVVCLLGGARPESGQPVTKGSDPASLQEVTGTIVGQVELRAPAQLVRRERGARYRGVTPMAESDENKENLSEQRNVVVYLEGVRSEVSSPSDSKRAAIDQRHAAFVPHVLAIQRGTTVDFINHDKTYHNVFSLSPVKRFNIGRRPTGEAVPVQFDKSGVVQVFCDIHSQMTAYVIVLDNSFFAQPNDDGSFRIEHVPPGTYTLKVWHERLSAPDQKITVSAGSAVKANLVLE